MNIISRKEAKNSGLKYYFTGNPCKNGHVSKRRVGNGTCFECHLEVNAKWRNKNPSYMNRWYEDNKDKSLAQQRDRYEKNKSEILRRNKAYRDKNREKLSKGWLRWAKENPEKLRYIQKRYEAKPRYKMARFMRNSLYRILMGDSKNSASSSILGYSASELRLHIEKQFMAGMSWENYGDVWHIDHIIPVSKLLSDGEDSPKAINCLSNLRPIYAKENLRKGSKVESLL